MIFQVRRELVAKAFRRANEMEAAEAANGHDDVPSPDARQIGVQIFERLSAPSRSLLAYV